MDDRKRSLYVPVGDQIVTKLPRDPLQQGTLQSTSGTNFSSSVVRTDPSTENIPNKTVPNATVFANTAKMTSQQPKKPKILPHSPANTLSEVFTHRANSSQVHIDRPRKVNISSAKSHLQRRVMDSDSGSFIAGGSIDRSSTARAVFADQNDNSQIKSTAIKDNVVHGEIQTEKKKKKKGKVVSSRYKTSAAKVTGNSANSESSMGLSVSKNTSVKRQPSFERRKTQQSSVHRKPQKDLPKPNISNTKVSSTATASTKKLNNIASTPYAAFKSLFQPEMSHIEVTESRKKQQKPQHSSSRDKSQISQDDLEWSRNRLLQIQYLQTRIAESATTRHNEALKSLAILEETNKALREEVYENEKEVKMMQNQKLLDQVIDTQRSALGPVINKMEDVKENYCMLAKNMDASRHVLPIESVIVPDNLENILVESHDLMNDISNLTFNKLIGCQQLSEQSSKLNEESCDVTEILTSSENLSREMQALGVLQFSLESQYQTELKK